ncbi:Modification methylase HpaII [subsurface metagenome]
MNHKGGRTLNVILNVLRDDLNYYVPDPQIVNAKYYGVPQNRERVFIIGFKNKSKEKKFRFPNNKTIKKYVKDILETEEVSSKYSLSTQYLKTLREHRRGHEEKGHGFGYEVIDNSGIANAIVVGGMGRERNLVTDKRLKNFTPVTKITGEVNK